MPAKTPAVSVVVPCYNAQATIAETLASALSQDVSLEVIVIDDGSTDGSRAVLESFGERITVQFGPNRGVSAARNSGIDQARGTWIQFLDSDDLLCPGALGRRLKAGAEGDVVIDDWREFSVVDGAVVEGRARAIDATALARDAELCTAVEGWAPPAAVLYRREIVERIGGFRTDLPVIQDARFLFDAAYHGARFVHEAQVGARYRVLPDSLSRRSSSAFWRDVLRNGQQIEALWRARGEPLPEARRQALIGIYDTAARGLFDSGEPAFAEAVAEQRRLGGGSRHSQAAALLTRWLGQTNARRALALLARR